MKTKREIIRLNKLQYLHSILFNPALAIGQQRPTNMERATNQHVSQLATNHFKRGKCHTDLRRLTWVATPSPRGTKAIHGLLAKKRTQVLSDQTAEAKTCLITFEKRGVTKKLIAHSHFIDLLQPSQLGLVTPLRRLQEIASDRDRSSEH